MIKLGGISMKKKFNFKKITIFLMTILIFSLLAGCRNRDLGEQREEVSIQDNNEYEKSIRKVPEEDLEILNNLKVDDVEKFIIKTVEDVSIDFGKAKLININVYEDPLLLKRDSYEKAYNNIFVEIKLELQDGLSTEEKKDITKKYSEDILFSGFDGPELENIKINKIDIYFMTDTETYDYHEGMVIGNSNEDTKNLESLQSEELQEVDKEVYNIVNKNFKDILGKEAEFYIARMGILDKKYCWETKLFVYLGDDVDKDIDTINSNILKEIKDNKIIYDFLKEKKIDNIEMIYEAIWHSKDSMVYEYKLSEID